MTSTMTADEMFQSLTGFDEIGIEKAFGEDISVLTKRPTQYLRALIFIERKRAGDSHEVARKAAQELTMGEVLAYFPDAEVVDPVGEGQTPSA